MQAVPPLEYLFTWVVVVSPTPLFLSDLFCFEYLLVALSQAGPESYISSNFSGEALILLTLWPGARSSKLYSCPSSCMAVISHFILWALSVVILFECGITAPPPLKHSKRSFRVHRRQYGSGQREASRELRKAYQKFGIPLTTGLLEPAADNANHESIAKATNSSIKKHSGNPDAGDVEFLAPITIGGQQLMMNFDTGSSDL